jgi:hypothetical protein
MSISFPSIVCHDRPGSFRRTPRPFRMMLGERLPTHEAAARRAAPLLHSPDSERLAMIGETPTATMSEREARECSRI